jgi:hypothetical protein
MTPTTLRPAAHGRRAQTSGDNRRLPNRRFSAVFRHGAVRAVRAPASPARPPRAAPMWSLLLPSYCTHNPTEEAMPDPNAGPSHKPRARIPGGPA